jgi:hypothetical protein
LTDMSKTILEKCKPSADFSAFKNQSLDKCKQISQFITHENSFGCVQNKPPRTMQINLPFCANENGFGYIQNESLDKCKQISQFIALENGFGCV